MGKTYKDLTRIPKKDHTLNESFKYKKKRHVKLEPYSRKRAVFE